MGITGLLPFLKAAGRPVSVRELAGQTVAVDTYCWLHKGAYACADKLGMRQETDQYVHYCMRYVRLLLAHRVRIVLVFDGQNLPAKAVVEQKRRDTRAAYRRKAIQLMAEGKTAEAREAFERCIDVTPAMALAVMQAARREGADTIVAPYEADAQLAHLCNAGLADAVISEDSDLLTFGCKRVIFKLDSQGNGLMLESSDIAKQLGIPEAGDADAETSGGGGGMTWAKFRWMCILSGCDYFPGVPGVGLATAAGIVRRTCLDLRGLAGKLFLYAKKIQRLTKDQVEAVVKADLAFQHQVVFDPIARRQIRLNPAPARSAAADVAADADAATNSDAWLEFAGRVLADDALALQLAHGNVDFRTMQTVADFDPDAASAVAAADDASSIWASGGCGGGKRLPGRRVPSDAALLSALTGGADAAFSPYFSSCNAVAASAAQRQPLWRSSSYTAFCTDKDGGGQRRGQKRGIGDEPGAASLSTEKLRRLYEAVAPASVDEKENDDSSASSTQAPEEAPTVAPAAVEAGDSLRRPEFRLFGGSFGQPPTPFVSPPRSSQSRQQQRHSQQQTVLSRYFQAQPVAAAESLQSPKASPSSTATGGASRHRLFPTAQSQSKSQSPAATKPGGFPGGAANAPYKSPVLLGAFCASQPPRLSKLGDSEGS